LSSNHAEKETQERKASMIANCTRKHPTMLHKHCTKDLNIQHSFHKYLATRGVHMDL